MEPTRRYSPAAIRPKLVLEIVSEMMEFADWPWRQVRMTLRDQGAEEEFAFSLFGGAKPSTVDEVARGELDISMLNPSSLLTMAYRGVGTFADGPRPVRTVAVIPSEDNLAFGVAERTGIRSFDDIREKQYPLKLSVRGSHDPAVRILVDQVLETYGFTLDDVDKWGGEVSYNQEIASGPTRIGAFERGELDAIFDEAIHGWASRGSKAGMRFLPVDDAHMKQLEAKGFRRGLISSKENPGVPEDVPTPDFSGWPIYTSAGAPDHAIRAFCMALHARQDRLILDGKPLPLAQMVRDTPEGPLEVPLHPAAEQAWRDLGYL
jgi:TRAP-type uncharacterized transport system substrate-binding protein